MTNEFVQKIRDDTDKRIGEVHTAFPGTIVSYDPATNMAEVLPGIQLKKPDGTKMDYPKISGVPVCCVQASGQNAVVALPIKAGDGCMVVVSEKAIDKWLYGQETDTDLYHDITNAMCVPGMFAKGCAVQQEACSTGKIIVDCDGARGEFGEGKATLKAGGAKVDVGGGGVQVQGNLTVAGAITASGAVHGSNI